MFYWFPRHRWFAAICLIFLPLVVILTSQVRANGRTLIPLASLALITPTSQPNDAPPINFYSNLPMTLTWNPVSWATEYQVQISTDPSFDPTAIYALFSFTADKLSFTIETLSSNTYYWQVRALNSNRIGEWSEPDIFVLSIPPSPTATAGTNTAIPSSTETPTSTDTPTNTAPSTSTFTSTYTPISTYTLTSTDTATNTATSTRTNTPTNTSTPTSFPTPTNTATATSTYTATNTAIPSPTAACTATMTPSPTITPGLPSITPTFGASPTAIPTRTPTLGPSPTVTPTLGCLPTATLTPSKMPTPTKTPQTYTPVPPTAATGN